MSEISQLISDYLDGELDDGGVERLAGALRADVATVDQLILDSFVHSQLCHWMNVRHLRDDILADAIRGMQLPDCSFDPRYDSEEMEPAGRDTSAARHSARRNRLGIVAALATMLLIGVSIYTVRLISERSSIVGQLTQANGCQWDASTQDLAVGSLLHAGQRMKLRSGRALVTFACGAQMIVEGPTSVQLDSASKVDLSQGRVSAKVPTQAIGFTVTTPSAHFVDLGTEFTLALEASNVCTLQVFDGLVELRLFERDGHTIQQRLRISEGTAVRLDATGHDVVSIPYDEKQRIVP
jgi:ferric-dicitrate binding protein FerR (iron transport regulator)